MKKSLLYIFILFIQFLYSDTLELKNENKTYENFKIEFFEDKNKSMTFQEIKNQKFNQKANSNFNLGYRKGNIWIKLDFKNYTSNTNYILTLNETFYEKANLFHEELNEIKEINNGMFFTIKQREIKDNSLSFNIKLNPNEQKTYYLQLEGKYAYFGSVQIFEASYFNFKKHIGVNILFIFIIGVLFIILLFSIFLYSKVKEVLYLYYIGYIFFTILYILNISGLLVYLDLQKYIYKLHISAPLMMSFLILFSLEYLAVKSIYIKTYKFFYILSMIFFILAFLLLFSYEPWNKIVNNLAGISTLSLIIFSIILYFKGHTRTKYYIFVLILYFCSVILFTFMIAGIFAYNNITRYGFIFSILIEVSIFSLLIANRYDEMKRNIQTYLEEEVQIRTKDVVNLADERKLLLKEIHHRVKNNFHTINSLLWFESQKDKNNSHIFIEVSNRIKSMSLLHEYLYNSKDLKNIHTKEYLANIIRNIHTASSNKNIQIVSDIEDISLTFDDAVSIGSIVNEVLTNSVKHNKNIKNLICEVKFYRRDNELLLEIKDNGKGFDINKIEKGLGLNLIEDFSLKLKNSDYHFDNKSESNYFLKFDI